MWPFSKPHTHNWEQIDKKPVLVSLRSLFRGDYKENCVLIVNKCADCQSYEAYLKTIGGEITNKVDMDYLEAVLGYEPPK